MVHRVTTSDNEWQRVTTSDTTSDNEWQVVVQRVTTNDNSDNEWQWVVQQMTTSGTMSDNEWKRVIRNEKEWQRMRKSNNKWQWVTASDSKWYNEWKQQSTLQRMDDCHPFYDKNRYTTSKDGWLQLEWLKKYTGHKVFQESSWS